MAPGAWKSHHTLTLAQERSLLLMGSKALSMGKRVIYFDLYCSGSNFFQIVTLVPADQQLKEEICCLWRQKIICEGHTSMAQNKTIQYLQYILYVRQRWLIMLVIASNLDNIMFMCARPRTSATIGRFDCVLIYDVVFFKFPITFFVFHDYSLINPPHVIYLGCWL